MQKIGLLGGTFNPLHNGHIAMGASAYRELALDEVWYIMNAAPTHCYPKTHPQGITIAQRWAMLEQGLAGHEQLLPCAVELQRNRESYTIDTIRVLRTDYPEAVWYLIVGEDSLRELHTWKESAALCREVQLVGVRRSSTAGEAAPRTLPAVWLALEPVNISSSLVRERVRAGAAIDGLVPPSVAAYIAEHRLYQEQ